MTAVDHGPIFISMNDRRTFAVTELRRSIDFRATVIARLHADLARMPARFLPETSVEYARRCASRRVVTEAAIEREARARAFEVAELAYYEAA